MRSEAYNAPRCPGTLKEGFTSYSPATLRKLYNGKQVFHVLDNAHSKKDWEGAEIRGDHYGNQQWFGMSQIKNRLFPDDAGSFLIKTVQPGPGLLRFPMEQMGNEHFCLQLASQVFKLETTVNALIFFPDGQPALISKGIARVETFKVLWQETYPQRPLHSYFDISKLIDIKCAATMLAKERFFTQVLFNWIAANAGAYAKTGGLTKTLRGDYVLAPLHATMCTRVHELGPEFSLPGGLFEGDKNSNEYRENGCYTRNEFLAFGKRIGMKENRVAKILDQFVASKNNAEQLLQKAFLPDEAKATIRFNLLERISRLK